MTCIDEATEATMAETSSQAEIAATS